jgi:ribosomal protein L37AE/L43A
MSGQVPSQAGEPADSRGSSGHANRQAVLYCPYCAEETLFPLEDGGWECRSCLRAFTVRFLGLRPARGHGGQVRP